MSENYYLISDNDVHMPIRCTMQRFDHIRQQMHDYFEFVHDCFRKLYITI